MVAPIERLADEMIQFTSDGRMRIHFNRFDQSSYRLFLRAKALPEHTIEFHRDDETYTLAAPARFAGMLGVERPREERPWLAMSPHLFDDQEFITKLALDAGRFAYWGDCGLGKTIVMLEWGRLVIGRTGGKVLLVTLNEVVQQVIDEAANFYGESLPLYRITSRADLKRWCVEGSGLAITNYEKFNPDDHDGQVVNECRRVAGVVLDESSRLKAGGGKQKWAIIKSFKGVEFKLSLTATPAPNDTMEFASQASFLEKMRTDADIIWTYFQRDPKTHRWTVKKHARAAFFRFMSSWSIYVRDPRRYGWRKNHPDIPKPIVEEHRIEPTDEQRRAVQRFSVDRSGQRGLFQNSLVNTIQRAKLSQIAKGFAYRKTKSGRAVDRIASRKPAFVADLAASELAAGRRVLIWTVFDAESDIIAEELRARGVPFDLLTGATKADDRLDILERFRRGESHVLVSRAKMLGYGQNFQKCGSMIFSGWSDSYEAWYQAIRRAYRYGQTEALRVHVPVIEELEGDMLQNIFDKQDRHEAAIEEMERNYIEVLQRGEA